MCEDLDLIICAHSTGRSSSQPWTRRRMRSRLSCNCLHSILMCRINSGRRSWRRRTGVTSITTHLYHCRTLTRYAVRHFGCKLNPANSHVTKLTRGTFAAIRQSHWPSGSTFSLLPYTKCTQIVYIVDLVYHRSRADAVLPLSEPIRGLDGKMMHEILVPKDTTVFVGILSSNRNKAIWGEDALEWKPERWLSPLPDSVNEAKIPGVYSNLCVASLSCYSLLTYRHFSDSCHQNDIPRRRAIVHVSIANRLRGHMLNSYLSVDSSSRNWR